MFADPRRQKQLQKLVQKLGLSPTDPVDWSLMDLALTHPSISLTHNYEQLEFVGDSVVRLVTAELLLEDYPQEKVGEFAAVRSILVSDRVLAQLAESHGIEPYLIIGTNATGNSTGRQSWLADAFEAVLGALYLSTHNMDLIRPWLDSAMKTKAIEVMNDPARYNYKDALQEWTQGKYKTLPEYQVAENKELNSVKLKSPKGRCEAPSRGTSPKSPIVAKGFSRMDDDLSIRSADGLPQRGCALGGASDRSLIHERRFVAEVWFQGNLLGKGYGRSKKASEQAAAKSAFEKIKNS